MSWIVYQEHEYFGTQIISVEKTEQEALRRIVEIIIGYGGIANRGCDGRKWTKEMLREVKLTDNSIVTQLGFYACKLSGKCC